MGCAQSKQNGSMDELALLKQLLDDSQTAANEQQNLLRFKIEVLVNMLAMEEKKSETTNKRLETLKWLMHSQGVSEQTLTDILKNSEDIYNEKQNEGSDGTALSSRGNRLIDLSGAIARMTEDFKDFREDILHSFAEMDGKIVANLTTEEFSKQLYVVTDKVSKTDIHILSMRFSDGLGSVSIPEFLEFFTTPAQMRMAKAATAAVRMSLDLLQLAEGVADDDGEEGDGEDLEEQEHLENGEGVLVPTTPNRSHRTDKLESGVRRLVDIWHLVQPELAKAFTLFEENGQEQIVTVEIFKKTLTDICGKKSVVLRKAALDAKSGVLTPSTPQLQRQQSAADRSQAGTPSFDNGIVSPKPTDVSKSTTGFNNPKKPPLATSKSVTSLPPPSSSVAKLTREGSTSGASSEITRSSSSPPVEILPLDETDVNMLVARFELSGLIHCGHFIQYFTDLSRNQQLSKKKRTCLPADMSGISPFRLSSEWVSLRKSASINSGGLPLMDSSPRPSAAEPSTPSSVVVPPTPKESLSLINPTSLKNGTTPLPASPKVVEPVDKTADAKKDPAVIVGGKGDDKAPDLAPTPVPTPPVGVEVVGFGGCCGRVNKPAPNAPIELPPVVADPKVDTVPVAESKTSDDKLSLDTKEDLSGPKDAAFNTPKGILNKKKPDTSAAPSFRPKVVETVGAGGVLRREGLGLNHSDEETETDENRKHVVKGQGQARLQNARQAVEETGNSRFHRRAEKSFDKEKKRNPLSDDEDDDVVEELDTQPANIRRK